MFVTPLGPYETINWFERLDRQHEILCFMICADPRHRATLREISQNYIDSDVALGSKVAFILFGGDVKSYPEVDFHHSNRMFLPGEPLQPSALRSYADRNYFGRSGAQEEDQREFGGLESYQVDVLAAETVSASSAWMNAMGVKRSSLPALCVLVKGNDPAVISLGEAFDTAKLLKLFGRLADIAERDCEEAMKSTFDAEARIARALALHKGMNPLRESFIQQMEAMCNRFKATPDERTLIAEFLVQKDYSAEALDGVLSKCKFSSTPGFELNTTVKGVRNKISKLAKATADLEECRPQDGMVTSLSEAIEIISARRQETARLVRELLIDGVEAKTVDRQALGVTYDKYAARANQTANLIEKAGKFVGLMTGAGLIAQILK